MAVRCDLRQVEAYQVKEHLVLTNDNLEAVNTENAPDTVIPSTSNMTKLDQGHMETVLGKHSWNVIRLGK